jgi:hypothetical protein
MGTGEVIYGEGNRGELSFGQDGFAGTIEGGALGHADFESEVWRGDVDDYEVQMWAREYESMNGERYEYERINRWR